MPDDERQNPIPHVPDLFHERPRSKTGRNRNWEFKQRTDARYCTVTYRGIPRVLRDKIKEHARANQVSAEALARLLIEEGLRRYEAGHVELPRIAVITTTYKLAFEEDERGE